MVQSLNSQPFQARSTDRGNQPAAKIQKPALNKIINDNDTFYKKQYAPPSFLQRFATYPSYGLAILPLLGYELLLVKKIITIKKQIPQGALRLEKMFELNKEMPKNLLKLGALAVPLLIATDYINNKNRDKHFSKAQKSVDNFNKENQTDIKISSKSFSASYIGAMFSPISGGIIMGEKMSRDSILANTHQKHMLNHELVHADQYILMARSKNGIEKLNYIEMKKIANSLGQDGRKEVFDGYQEIKAGVDNKYKNAKIESYGYKINLVDYVTALYKILNEDAKPKDIPIVINKDFYQSAIDKKGKLSTAEEKKAEAYMEANAKYPTKISLIGAFNPNSDYRQNLLEKEAYKMNPWYTR